MLVRSVIGQGGTSVIPASFDREEAGRAAGVIPTALENGEVIRGADETPSLFMRGARGEDPLRTS